MEKERVLFIYTRISTFIRGDLDILEKKFPVTTLVVDNSSKIKQAFSITNEFFYLLFNVLRYDIVYIWFADYHSFFPVLFSKLFRKKVYLVIGGYDVCRVKKWGYGSFSNPIRGFMTRYSITNASLNLCVSQYIERVTRAISPFSKRVILYNGIVFSKDSSKCIEDSKERLVLCVALSSTPQSFYIKGVDRFINVAKALPEIPFTIIGINSEKLGHLIGEVPANLKIIPKVEHYELAAYYQIASVYCQLSRKESFSLALAEAMYHNCIPVISNTGGMPEVTGGLGKIVSGNDVDETVSAIKDAMGTNASFVYRERVEQKFTAKLREKELLNILSKG
jgi:glycosyltransferase involved in cell wall biosynthesis